MQGRTIDENLRRANGSMAAAAARRMSATLLVGVLAMSGRAHAQAPTGNVDRVRVSRIHASVLVDTNYGADMLVPNDGYSQCRIQLDGPYTGGNDVDVTLWEDNSTGGRVNIDEPMVFTLPANKTAVPFALMGVIDSEAVDDVLLTVRDPENLWAGEAKATVYSFGNPALGITSKNPYSQAGPFVDRKTGTNVDTYQPHGGPAVEIQGSLEVKPHGVVGSRITGTHIALVQNAMGGNAVRYTHNGPVEWGFHPAPPYAPYGRGDTVAVPVSISAVHEMKVWTPDCNSGEYPQVAADSDVAMRGGDDLARVSASDSPNMQFPDTTVYEVSVQGVTAIEEGYGHPGAAYNEQFQDWLVTYEASAPSSTMAYWAEATWNLKNTNGAEPLMAKLGASSIPPNDAPTMPLQQATVANQIGYTIFRSTDTFTETHP